MAKEEHPLIELLEDDDLRTQAKEIWRRAKEYHSKQQGDNIQDTLHCVEVEKNLYKLIRNNKKKKSLKQIDLFLLCIAACLHDIGKIVDDDTIRWEHNHGKRSKQIILEKYRELGLDKGQAIAVAYIVSVHDNIRVGELPEQPVAIGTEEVNVVDLAAIFCLGDKLESSYKRTPELLSDIIYRDEDIPPKWLGRQSITGWYLNDKNEIILQAAPDINQIEAALTLWEIMNTELSRISHYLEKYDYPYELGKPDVSDVLLLPAFKKKAVRQRPFPGLGFYTTQDASIFKGRNDEIEKLLSYVNTYPITLLIGESGVGKTSLIQAGLFPFLEVMSWRPVYTRPFDSPVEDIKKTIWDKFFEEKFPEEISLLNVMRKVADKHKSQKILLVIDQFEDILNFNNHKALDNLFWFLRAVYSETVIPNIIVLISFREDSFVELNSRILKKITGSACTFPSLELEKLTRDGAKSAFLAGLENAGIGPDHRQEKGENLLIETILDDIQKGDRIYPPDIQMVAETLFRKVDLNNRVVTREMYKDLGDADSIIAHYLLEKLDDLGSRKSEAEKVLVHLVSPRGEKIQRNIHELSQQTQIETDELKAVMNEMVDLRMIQRIGSDKFEIINDYLARTVNEELVKEEGRIRKFLEEQLDLFSQMYEEFKTPILSFPFMAKLYRYRRRIKIREEQYPLILCTAFKKSSGVGWFWLKDKNDQYLLEMIKDLLKHETKEIKKEAISAWLKIATPQDKGKIIELLRSEDQEIQKTIGEVFIDIATPEDKNIINEMLRDEDPEIRAIGSKAFIDIATPEDKNIINEMLRDEVIIVRETAAKAFKKIATPQDKGKIIELLRKEKQEIQKTIGEAFIDIATPEDKNTIIDLFHDEDWIVRETAVKAFFKITMPEDKDILIKTSRDEEEDVKEQDIKKLVLNFVLEKEDKKIIFDLIKSICEDIREIAAKKLLKIVTAQDKDIIIGLMHDENLIIREIAAKKLLKIVTAQDKDIIIGLLRNGEWDIKRGAARAFLKIATPEDKNIINEMLRDEDIIVREIAAEAFINLSKPREIENSLDQFSDKARSYTEEKQRIFNALAVLDRELYCPYSNFSK